MCKRYYKMQFFGPVLIFTLTIAMTIPQTSLAQSNDSGTIGGFLKNVLGSSEDEEEEGKSKGLKEKLGTAAGAIGGGLLGSKVGSGTGQYVAVAAGAFVGGWLGSKIGAAWDKSDQEAVRSETAKALAGSPDGHSTSWQNAENGNRATVTPISTRPEEKKVTLLRSTKVVSPLPPMTVIGKNYNALKVSNVRAGPTTSADKVSKLAQGEIFEAIGQVKNKSWIVVGQEGNVIGFVHDSLVGPVGQSNQVPDIKEASAKPIHEEEGWDLDEMGLEEEEVIAESECRTMEVELSNNDGESDKSQLDACKSPDGTWEIG